jgi:4-amino-4-deoxy-L-arabinose transferase-like glycosyltransferase
MMSKKQGLFLGLILVLAVFFRFYLINSMPGGLFPDEAANGLDINLMQQGHLQPFYERGNGREALFFYMLWGSITVFGKSPWAHHIVSALIGVLSVLLCFLVTKRLFSIAAPDKNESYIKHRAINIALLASFLMAVSTWHIVLSRTAFRAIQIPLFSSMTFYFLICVYDSIRALKKSKAIIFAILAGASFALGFNTYIAFRIMAPIVFVILLWPLLASIKNKIFSTQIKKYFFPAVFFVFAFCVVISPIAKYFYTHPGSFVGRSGQVSVFNPDQYLYNGQSLHGKPSLIVVVNVVAEVAKESVLGFFTKGDLNWRHNISGVPFLSPLYSIFFGVGLIAVLWLAIRYFFSPAKKQEWWKFFVLTVWFWAMLLPVITTAEGIPHGLRSIGMIPVVFIISAWALYVFVELISKLHKKIWSMVRCPDVGKGPDPYLQKQKPNGYKIVILAFKLLAACFFLALILQTYYLYFVFAANSPENFYAFRSDLTPVSEYLKQRCQKENTYLILDKFSVQTTDYLTSDDNGNFQSPCNVPYLQVDPEESFKLSNLKKGDEIIFTQSSVFDAKKFKQYHPEAQLTLEYRNKFQQTIMAIYKVK